MTQRLNERGWKMTGEELRSRFIEFVKDRFTWVDPSEDHYRNQLQFASHRIDEGLQLLNYFGPRLEQAGEGAAVLDVGAGNGGVILPFANAGYRACAFDVVPNPDVMTLRTVFERLSPVVGRGSLPFGDDSFSVVLLLDVLEHVDERERLCREIMRVLRPGGQCMITTPARLRHIFGRDPHFEVPLILMLPNSTQRFIVNKLFGRTFVGFDGVRYPAYDVEHIFWHVKEVVRLFPGPKEVDVLFNRPLAPSRFPRMKWFDFRLRNFFWDRIVITKVSP